MDHLLRTSRRGITAQLYVADFGELSRAVIAVLLMHAQSGRRVSIYAPAALSRVAAGTLTPDQAMAEVAKRERERDLARARQARLRASKTRA